MWGSVAGWIPLSCCTCCSAGAGLSPGRRRSPRFMSITVCRPRPTTGRCTASRCANICKCPLIRGCGRRAAGRAARRRPGRRAIVCSKSSCSPGQCCSWAITWMTRSRHFFLRLMRGAGVHGLAAIPRQRPMGEGRLVRPLLIVTRNSCNGSTSGAWADCVEDPSNSDTAMDRNFPAGGAAATTGVPLAWLSPHCGPGQ